MRRALLSPAALILLFLCCVRVAARQATQEGLAVSPKSIEAPLLKVCLRLEDDSPFGGIMRVRILPAEGDDISGAPTGSDGETIFRNLKPGTYFLEVSAPGFVTVRREVRVETGHGLQTLFVTMKPLPLPATASGNALRCLPRPSRFPRLSLQRICFRRPPRREGPCPSPGFHRALTPPCRQWTPVSPAPCLRS